MPGQEQRSTIEAGDERSWRAFDEVVRGRRAVRDFSPERVTERDMNDLLDAAVLAPTSSNLQAFELVWARSEQAKAQLVRACMNQSAARTAAELVVCIARWDRCDVARREIASWLRGQNVPREALFYYDWLVPMVYRQGPLDLYGRARRLALSPVLWFKAMPRGPASREDVRVWAVKSAALVCENFMLAARAKGLDTCPMEGADPLRVGDVVGMRRSDWKKTWDMTMVLAVGHRAPDAKGWPQWRRAREKLVREV